MAGSRQGAGKRLKLAGMVPWSLTVISVLLVLLMMLANNHLTSVEAAGSGTNIRATPDSVRIATGDMNATLDAAASTDITSKMTNLALSGSAATVDLAETTGTTADRYISVRETVASGSYDGQIILRVYIASIDQPLRLKVYPYSSTDLTRVFLASPDSYPIAPNTLTSIDVYRPIINLIPRTATSDATRDAGWININVTHLAQYLRPSTTLKFRLGLEMPSGTNVKASIGEVMLNFVSNAVPHDNYIMLSTDWCGQCHSRHNGGQNSNLRPPAEKSATPGIFTAGQQTKEEAVCYVCHDGTGSTKDLRSEFRKSEAGNGGAMRIWRYLGSHNRKENTASGDTYDYVADGANGLMIIDTANPASPTLVASVDTPGSAEAVFVMDQYAFVADGTTGLQIIELEDPAGPRIIASYDTAGYAADVYVSSKDAYIADRSNGVVIVNVSNRTAPTLTGSIDAANAASAEALMVWGGTRPYTLAAGSGGTENTYLIVARGGNGISAYDVTNPAAPGAPISPANPAGDERDVYVIDDSRQNIYLAHGTGGISVYEFDGSFSAALNYNTSGDAQGIFSAKDETEVATNDPVVFVADGSQGLSIITAGPVSNGGLPTLLSAISGLGTATDVNVVGNYAYVAASTDGLRIVNVSNLRTPSLTSTYNTPGIAKGVSITYSVHVECFDCHNPHLATYQDRYRGKRGINGSGDVVGWGTSRNRLFQYEVCFQCHGNSVRRAVGRIVEDIPNNFPYSNKVREFDPANSSYHPIEAPGKNWSPALQTQLKNATSGQTYTLSTSDTILCADCHNNDLTASTAGPVANYGNLAANMTQALGLHGSTFTTNKRAFYWNDMEGPDPWATANFNLCLRCHDSNCFVGGTCTNFNQDTNESRGNLHAYHLDNRSSTALATCKTCHYNIHSNVDASNTQYTITHGGVTRTYYRPPSQYPTRLINYAPDLNATGTRRRGEWVVNLDTAGEKNRTCNVECHGNVMNFTYNSTAANDDLDNRFP